MSDTGPTLQFLTMVDGAVDGKELSETLERGLGAAPYRRGSMHARGNLIEIQANEGADAELARTDEDDYLYFRWRVEATPVDRSVGEAEQIALAKDVVRVVRDAGLRAVVCAAFEDRV